MHGKLLKEPAALQCCYSEIRSIYNYKRLTEKVIYMLYHSHIL